MFHTVLVPLDGSAFAEQALPLAAIIARRSDARLALVRAHLLYAFEESASAWTSFNPAADEEFRRQEHGYLEVIAQRILTDSGVRATYGLVDGLAVDAILERAHDTHADLIVMTTHGHGPISRAFLGSVSDELVRRSSAPVLLIRPTEALATHDQEPSITRILIPLDRSAASEQIFGPAWQLGSALGASYTLLHVVNPDMRPSPQSMPDRASGSNRPWHEHEVEQSLAYLSRVAARLQTASCNVQTRVVVSPHAPSAIVDEARAQSCDLIALATHGFGGIKRLLLGSVADKVVRSAACPILLYCGQDH